MDSVFKSEQVIDREISPMLRYHQQMVTSGREMHARPDRRGVRSVVCACCFETTPNLEPDMAAMVRTLHVGLHDERCKVNISAGQHTDAVVCW